MYFEVAYIEHQRQKDFRRSEVDVPVVLFLSSFIVNFGFSRSNIPH